MDSIPIWVLFIATIFIVGISIEAGYRLGHIVQRSVKRDEKESSVSAVVASVLGLPAFILAFTFGIVYERFETRKVAVLNEANAIRTAWERSDFLPDPDHKVAEGLLLEYVDIRLAVARSRNPDQVENALNRSTQIRRQLWHMAVLNARKDMDSDVAALYIQSLNSVVDLHTLRVAVGIRARIPDGIWIALYTLVILGMLGVGYQGANAKSQRSWASLILAFSFSVVIALIGTLDRPHTGFITVSQQALVDVRDIIAEDLGK